MFLTYQYGLRPKRQQHRRLEAILEGQRLLYNAALKECSQAWSKSHWSVTRVDQTKSLTTIRAFDPLGYGALPVTLPRWSLKKVDKASLLPSHQGQGWQGRRPALQIEA